MNRGILVTWAGIIMAIRNITKIKFFPGKLSREKAYAAIEQTMSWEVVIITDTKILFLINIKKFTLITGIN
jgi:hypothetical protein